MSQTPRPSGTVYLVGGGPGDPGLITVRGRDCLARADVVFYDYLTNPELLAHAPAAAQRVCLGHPHRGRNIDQDQLNHDMIAAARRGATVVRLKSGDPFLFGRGAEEIAALTAAGVPFEVIPGVTAALAAAASAGIPLTHRQQASAVAFVTGHQRADKSWPEEEYRRLGSFPGTLVFYMGMTKAARWSRALIDGGKSPDTPVAIIRRATWPDEQRFHATLATLADAIQQHGIQPPTVIIVGDVAAVSPEMLREA